jgi:membrane protein
MFPSLTFGRHAPDPTGKPRRRLFGRRRTATTVVEIPRRPARFETAAWFALAIAILAWPRPAYGKAHPPETPLPPYWRRLFSANLRHDPVEAEITSVARKEPGRGRDAQRPGEIPAPGWKDILWRTWNEFHADRVPAVAGSVTFFALLALFPALAAFVSLYGIFADVETAREQLNLMAGLLPRDALNFVGDQMLRLAAGRGDRLGLAFIVSVGLSLWSANAGMKALFDGLNIAYEEKEKRGYIRLNAMALGFTLGAILFIILILAAVVALPVALSILGYAGRDPMWMLRWPLLLGVVVVGLAALYRFGPSRAHARWRWVSWGSVAAAFLWLAASMAFSWYVSNFGSYDKTYGSLGAVIGFLTWIWISVQVVLFGAELNAEIEHQTAVDSTTGPPEPMGRRHAKMADTLGKTSTKLAKEEPRPHSPPMTAEKLGPKR